MDLHKIIGSAINISVREVIERTDNSDSFPPTLAQITDDENVQTCTMLMKYSNNLLESYHAELQKELAKHGITI